MKRPRITRKILDGIILAVGTLEADGFQQHENWPEDIKKMSAAAEYAWRMKVWMDRRKTEKD